MMNYLSRLDLYCGSASQDKVEKFISTGSTLLDYAISNRKDGRSPYGKNSGVLWQ